MEQSLKVSEAAELLNRSARGVRQLLETGELEGFRLGSQWRIPRVALARYLGKVPGLQISSPHVDDYDDPHHNVARCVTLTVSTLSTLVARLCWARVELLKPTTLSLPLHWAGTPYGPQEYNSPKVDIYPPQPARLDVAFTLPPKDNAQSLRTAFPVMTSGQIALIGAPLDGDLSFTQPSGGCWLAQPLALFRPDRRLAAYLSPGTYKIRVTVGCSEGQGDSKEYELVSPPYWRELAIRSAWPSPPSLQPTAGPAPAPG